MEFIIWAFIFIVLFSVFKVLKSESQNTDRYQRDLARDYLAIKTFHSDYRYIKLKEWEKQLEIFVEQSDKKSSDNVLKINNFKVVK